MDSTLFWKLCLRLTSESRVWWRRTVSAVNFGDAAVAISELATFYRCSFVFIVLLHCIALHFLRKMTQLQLCDYRRCMGVIWRGWLCGYLLTYSYLYTCIRAILYSAVPAVHIPDHNIPLTDFDIRLYVQYEVKRCLSKMTSFFEEVPPESHSRYFSSSETNVLCSFTLWARQMIGPKN